jgi:pimeloyl-ACP methyl ester carboxylesterase
LEGPGYVPLSESIQEGAMDKEVKAGGAPVTRREVMVSLAAAGVGALLLNETVAWAQEAPKPSTWPGASRGPAPREKGFKNLSGVNVYYEESGQGIPVALTSGGMNPADTMRKVAGQLSAKYRAIGWDRSNTGQSDFVFRGSRDCDLWSDQLAELLVSLNAAPAYIASCSGGARTSFVFAIRYPDLTRGLVLWDITNASSYQTLPQRYFGQYADVAEKEGMEGVARTPYWSDLIKLNPSNRTRLLEVDPREFARVMRRWTRSYLPTDVALQISEADCRLLAAQGTPVRIVGGCDAGHNRATTDAMARLMPTAEYVTPPGFCEEEVKIFADAAAWARAHNETVVMPHYETPAIAPMIEDFITKTEARSR